MTFDNAGLPSAGLLANELTRRRLLAASGAVALPTGLLHSNVPDRDDIRRDGP